MTKVKFIASQQNLVDTGAKQAGQIVFAFNVTEDDLVRTQFDAESTIEANWAHILSSGEALSNNVFLYSKKIPRIPLSGLLSIVRSDE